MLSIRRWTPHLIACALGISGAAPLAVPLAAQRPFVSPPPRAQTVRADDGHPLTVWVRRPVSRPRGAIVLVHGRTWSALPNFDLQVDGQRLSLMDALVMRGYSVYALDQRGYGATRRDSTGWLTPERADRDLAAVLDWVAAREVAERDTMLPALLGYSRGAQVAMLAAQRHPEKLSAVVLYGFPVNLAKPHDPSIEAATPQRRHTTAEGAAEDFITPTRTPAGAKEAYVHAATSTDSIRVDWRHEDEYGALDAAAVHVPTLLLDGERDPYANAAGHAAMFPRIGTPDRWWVVLPGVDHVAHIEAQTAFVNAVTGFLERELAGPR